MPSNRFPMGESIKKSRLHEVQEILRAQQMEFILDRERQEADRKKVEALGTRDAQKIISEGLNPMIIQFMSIEAFEKLAESDNTKVIITDGKSPFLIEGQ